ncbi:BamA/TamA family outer membrane protein [Aliagarivorans taiwanensis]|uniref:BamA/TamA family outer membrane protein n=1 Tax=Aliagarivorans taiwanensis TaxID=561966 RepID=UPI0012F732E1|nr:BamA/TamA family outer membrane protein [Aliagarivorans taiwanensis]
MRLVLNIFSVLLGVSSLSLHAEEGDADQSRFAVAPFVMSSSSMGLAGGLAVSAQGYGQSQGQILGVGLLSDNNSHLTYLGVYNYRIPNTSRWYVESELLHGLYREDSVYVEGADGFDSPSGSHNSDKNNFVEGKHTQHDYRIGFRYVFPWGRGADDYQPAPVEMQDGLPGYGSGDVAPPPLVSMVISPFYKSREVENAAEPYRDTRSQGLKLGLDYDSRDFQPSPSRGQRFTLDVTRDFGGSHRNGFTKVEGQYSHYLNLGPGFGSKQNVLAMTGYLSDIPTWDKDNPEANAPWYEQSSVGTWRRLRGYSGTRFHDRSAVFYGAELRMIPNWQPQGGIPLIKLYNIPWWQFAVFGEVGRVHDELDLAELHSDMNWSAGFGMRVFIEQVVARIDMAYSDEGSELWVVVTQAF